MLLNRSPLTYSLVYHHSIPSTALELERLSCVCASSKSACEKWQIRRPVPPSLKQLSCKLSLLTLYLWLCGCVARRYFAKGSLTPENRLRLGAGLALEALVCSSCQRTHPAPEPQSASDTAVVQIRDAVQWTKIPSASASMP